MSKIGIVVLFLASLCFPLPKDSMAVGRSGGGYTIPSGLTIEDSGTVRNISAITNSPDSEFYQWLSPSSLMPPPWYGLGKSIIADSLQPVTTAYLLRSKGTVIAYFRLKVPSAKSLKRKK